MGDLVSTCQLMFLGTADNWPLKKSMKPSVKQVTQQVEHLARGLLSTLTSMMNLKKLSDLITGCQTLALRLGTTSTLILVAIQLLHSPWEADPGVVMGPVFIPTQVSFSGEVVMPIQDSFQRPSMIYIH